jgi:hypothetical protein
VGFSQQGKECDTLRLKFLTKNTQDISACHIERHLEQPLQLFVIIE